MEDKSYTFFRLNWLLCIEFLSKIAQFRMFCLKIQYNRKGVGMYFLSPEDGSWSPLLEHSLESSHQLWPTCQVLQSSQFGKRELILESLRVVKYVLH